MAELRAPFPWFGGKRRVADVVWRAFGVDVPNYVEPFAGSLAVLLGRPLGPGKIETVNDRDCYLANFWRAVHANPDAVAEWANWPVNEADLHARHAWLVSELDSHRARMHSDADYYDEKIAGWWVWGLCQWIGGGWCVVHATTRSQPRPNLNGWQGIHALSQQIPNLRVDSGASGNGVHASGFMRRVPSGWNTRPSLNRRPELGFEGKGVHLPALGNDRGINGVAAAPCTDWFRDLAARLLGRTRRVRVACGDWKRVLGPSVLGKGKNVGGRRPCAVFLDPPYSHEFRDPGLYSEDDAAISDQVREWALEHGNDPDLRIALCGYEGEHAMPSTWTVHAWKAARGYAAEGNDNRERERIWFSPHCLPIEQQRGLFEAAHG